MKVLVTGGAGFIGKHFIELLIKSGHEIIVVDNLETSHVANTAVEFHFGSIMDKNLINKLMVKIDYVVHLAAVVGVSNVIKSPLNCLKTNVLGSEIILSACLTNLIPILVVSSSEVYGKNDSGPLDELSDRVIGVPQKKRWSYSDSKAIEESFALAYHNEFGLPVKIVRLFNTVGPGQIGDYGMVLPRFFNAALKNIDLEIYGTGKQTRCFMHVSDAVNGLVKFMESKNLNGEVINLGNPEEISIKHLAQKIISISNSKSQIKYVEYEKIFGVGFEDMNRRIPNISKASSLLDWRPTKNIEEIVLDFYRYSKTNL